MRHQLEQIWTIWAPITSTSLLSSALRYCLQRAGNAAVLVGFTTPAQIEMSFTCLGEPLTDADLVFLRTTMGHLRQALEATGEVFLDEAVT